MSQNLRLLGFDGVLIGREFISTRSLSTMLGELPAFNVGIGGQDIKPKQHFLGICRAYLPFIMTAEGAGVRLVAQIEQFPYSIDGVDEFYASALRLWPTHGLISEISEDPYHGLAMVRIAATPEQLSYNIGNGQVRLELYFERQYSRHLPPISPPPGYRRNVVSRY